MKNYVLCLEKLQWRSFVGVLMGIVLLCFLFPASALMAKDVGPYVFSDPYKATVYGTPQKQSHVFADKKFSFEEASLYVKDRRIPEIFEYSKDMHYLKAMQAHNAPMIFLVAGTGAGYNSQKNMFLAQLFYEAGYHVVSLSSPTHMNFLVSVSQHGVSGYVPYDVKDLYRIISIIKTDLERQNEISSFVVAGYSLGGLHSAFLTKLDEKEKKIGFSKALMINPPVNLFNSIKRLDRYLTPENLQGQTVRQKIEHFIREFSVIYMTTRFQDFDQDFLYNLSSRMDLTDSDLKALVGISFRFSSSSLIFTSDVLLNAGYVVPLNTRLSSGSSLLPYGRAAFDIDFERYTDEFLLPYIQHTIPSITRQEIIYQSGLPSIEEYLKNSDKVLVIGNENDPILNDAEVAFLRETFADRVVLFPTGGHCGNIMYDPFAKKILEMVKP